jgi:hypothetical protein
MPHFKIRQMMFIVINNTKISSDSASHYLWNIGYCFVL